MSYRRNNRDGALRDRAGNRLLVKGPQVLEAPSAASDYQNIPIILRGKPACRKKRLRDLSSRIRPLDRHGKQRDVQRIGTPLKDLQYIPDSRARFGRDKADIPRTQRKGFLASRIEQPFGLQFLLELFEGELKRTDARGLHQLHYDLVLSPWFVNTQAGLAKHLHPGFRHKTQIPVLLAEKYGWNLAAFIL